MNERILGFELSRESYDEDNNNDDDDDDVVVVVVVDILKTQFIIAE